MVVAGVWANRLTLGLADPRGIVVLSEAKHPYSSGERS